MIAKFQIQTIKFLGVIMDCNLTWKYRTLRWRHYGRDSVSNHQPHHCLLSRLFRRRSKKASKLRVTGLCAGNSPGTCEFPAQTASNVENVLIWWRHHGISYAWSNISKNVRIAIKSRIILTFQSNLLHARCCRIEPGKRVSGTELSLSGMKFIKISVFKIGTFERLLKLYVLSVGY